MKKLLRNITHKIYFNLIHKRKLNKTVVEKLGNYRFKVSPSVFNPKDYLASEIFAKFISALDNMKNKKVLDMGCGSGVLSVFALSKEAVVTSADINNASVKCTEENISINGFTDNYEVIESNLFANLSSVNKFDLILFNPPYYKGEPKNDFQKGFYGGKNYEVVEEFFRNAKMFLSETGVIYVILSDDADLIMIEQIACKSGFKFNIEQTRKKYFETFYIYKLF
jgi:release factor glutamine methyltransferase